MKKSIFTALVCLALSVAIFAGCTPAEPQTIDSQYNVTLPQSADFSVSADKTSAKAQEQVTLTVTMTNTDKYLTAVKYNGNTCNGENGVYTFTMPSEDVSVTVETADYVTVTEDGDFATLDEGNLYTVAQNATHNSENILQKQWGFDVWFDSNYMSILNSEIISSDTEVIGADALSVKSYSKRDLGMSGDNDFEIVKAKVIIDTEKIGTGTTWLTMTFENDNLSPKPSSTFCVKVTVVPYGQLQVETNDATVSIDVSSAGSDGDTFTLRICDRDHIDGSTVSSAFTDYTLTVENGKITVTFKYVTGHGYWLRVTKGNADDYLTTLLISAKETATAVFTGDVKYASTGTLTITQPNTTVDLVLAD